MASRVEWEAFEFEKRQKDISWYWLSIVITLVFLGAAVWLKNFLFGFFLVVGEVLILTWANREPRMMHFALSQEGLEIIGEKTYPYSEIEGFSAVSAETTEWPYLVIRFHKKFKAPLRIGVPEDTSEKIQDFLRSFVPQTDYEPSFLDSLEKLIGF